MILIDTFSNLPVQEMRAICIDLHEHLGELKGQLFDVIVVSPFSIDTFYFLNDSSISKNYM